MSKEFDVKENIEEIKKVLNDFQEEHKAVTSIGKENSEGMIKLSAKFEELTVDTQTMSDELDSEKKAREALELAVARGTGNSNNDGEIKSDPEYMKGYKSFLRSRTEIPQESVNEEVKKFLEYCGVEPSDANVAQHKMLLVGSNPDGGYMVPVERLAGFSKRQYETSDMRAIAEIRTTGTEAVELPLDDGRFVSAKVGELDARGETDTSKIGIITIPVVEQQAMPIVTQKMLDDAFFPVESWVQEKIVMEFALVENEAFVNGSGAKEAEGFISLPDWATLGQYEREALETRETETASTLDGDDYINVQSDLLEQYQKNAVWTMHRKIWAETMKLKDTNGAYLLNPQMLFAGVAPQLLGAPVRMFGDMNSTVTDDTIIAAYGDFMKGYMIVDRIGIRVLRDPYTTKGQIKFYTTKRTGGAVQNYQAIKRLKVKAAA